MRWRRSPEEIGLCFRAVGVFTLTEGTAGAWGLWAALLSWLFFSWCICMSECDGYSCLGLRFLWGLVGYSCTSKLVPLFPQCMCMWWWRCQRGQARQECGPGWGWCAVTVLAGWPGHQADFDLLPLHWDREQASASMYYSRAHLSFLPPCGKPHSVFKQLSEVFFLVLDPRAGMPQWDLDPMLLRDDPWAHDILLLFWVTC